MDNNKKLSELLGAASPFHLPPAKVQEIRTELGLSQNDMMQALVQHYKSFARPPISNYLVSAVGLTEEGAIVIGVNLEFPGTSLGQTVHAEQSLVSNLAHYGYSKLQSIALSAPPCGHCRQFLNELENAGNISILTPSANPMQLKQLLPHDFGPIHLGVSSFMLGHGSAILDWKDRDLPYDDLATKALQAAEKSYAPYTNIKAGVAIEMENGMIHTGSYLESVAYNPSLPPLQVAIAHLVANHDSYDDISRVILVEARPNAHLPSQEEPTRIVLRSIAPRATLKFLEAERRE